MSAPRNYDGTVARIAGNVLSALVMHPDWGPTENAADRAVELARHIVAETIRHEQSGRRETPAS